MKLWQQTPLCGRKVIVGWSGTKNAHGAGKLEATERTRSSEGDKGACVISALVAGGCHTGIAQLAREGSEMTTIQREVDVCV